jgi:adenosylcobyric acid synthase
MPDGAISPVGRIVGGYPHGMFADDAFLVAFLARFGIRGEGVIYGADIEIILYALATHMEEQLAVTGIFDFSC